MATTISGDTGVSQIQDNTVTSAKIVNGAVQTRHLDSTNKLAQCKAWCNFNGVTVGTNAPRAGFNVTNITKNSAGDYTINFTNALGDANYILIGTIASNNASSSGMPIIKAVSQIGAPSLKTTTQCGIITPMYNSTLLDNVTEIYVAFFGN